LSMMLRSKPSSWRWGARMALVVLLALGLFFGRMAKRKANAD